MQNFLNIKTVFNYFRNFEKFTKEENDQEFKFMKKVAILIINFEKIPIQ